jgi:hypothetical protein
MRISLAAAVLSLCVLLPAPVAASMIAIEGHASGDVDNVLFNQASLIDSGLTVTGIVSGITLDFTENTTPLSTPSSGQARVAGLNDATFDWLRIMPSDPLARFLRFEANVKLTGPATIRITGSGSSTALLEFQGSNGENRVAVVADGDDWISWVLIQTTGGDFISDVRQVRISSSLSNEGPVDSLVATPEPGTLIMLATGLFGVAHQARRRLSR